MVYVYSCPYELAVLHDKVYRMWLITFLVHLWWMKGVYVVKFCSKEKLTKNNRERFFLFSNYYRVIRCLYIKIVAKSKPKTSSLNCFTMLHIIQHYKMSAKISVKAWKKRILMDAVKLEITISFNLSISLNSSRRSIQSPLFYWINQCYVKI